MATTQHYVWASGHFLLLLTSLRVFLATAFFKNVSSYWYKASFVGALISYAIVCNKSLGIPQPNPTWIKRALLDENMQYFIMAFFWFSSVPITLALLPYTIFSLFHALTFTRTTLMPQFLPPGPPTQAGGAPTPHPLAKKLQLWVKSNYDKAMRVVAYAELVILVRVLFGAIFRRNSLLAPLIFVHFLRARYYQSTFTQKAVGEIRGQIDGRVRQAGTPPAAVQAWDTFLMLVNRWAGAILTPAQPAGAAPARG